MKILGLIPARVGSKGLPGKNIRPLNNKPLIAYSIESALASRHLDFVIVSTDDEQIASVSKKHNAQVPFLRPADLATDTATSRDVILHAITFYKSQKIDFEYVVLLQPTSPFREEGAIDAAISLAVESKADLVVSVKETESNPYYVLFEEDENGYLKNSKTGDFTRRQDCPTVYELNGSIYVFKVEALLANNNLKFDKTVRFLMDAKHSVDIDTLEDFLYAEFLLQQ